MATLQDISLTVRAGELLIVIGPVGAGKASLDLFLFFLLFSCPLEVNSEAFENRHFAPVHSLDFNLLRSKFV